MNLTLTNYLLLALAMFQFPFLLWCTNVSLPEHGHSAASSAAAAGAGLAGGAAGRGALGVQ